MASKNLNTLNVKTLNYTDNIYHRGIPVDFNQGTRGVQGYVGAQGVQGYIGEEGPCGIQGDKGSKGIDGDQGIQGYKGPQGEEGPCGVQVHTGTQGAVGVQGAKGAKGDQGIKGENGEKGDTGAKGDQGIKGDTGAKGDKGDIGPSAIATSLWSTDGASIYRNGLVRVEPSPSLIFLPKTVIGSSGSNNSIISSYNGDNMFVAVNGGYIWRSINFGVPGLGSHMINKETGQTLHVMLVE